MCEQLRKQGEQEDCGESGERREQGGRRDREGWRGRERRKRVQGAKLAERGGGYREGTGEAETEGMQTSDGERGVGRGTSQRSGDRGTENNRGHHTPNGEAPAGGSPRSQGGGTRNGTHPRAFIGNTTVRVACGVRGVTRQLGHRAVRFPCGQGRHVLHARGVIEALARGTAPAPLRCPAADCGARHPRRDALEAAVQSDPGLRNRAAQMVGGTIGDEAYAAWA